MRRAWIIPLLAIATGAAYVAGRSFAEEKPNAPRNDALTTIALLQKRQKKLYEDIQKIENAAVDWADIQAQRAEGKYELNKFERKMERQGSKDFHIFMERYRNDTLDTLVILDRVLAKQAYVDPLRKVFGTKLDVQIDVDWEEMTIDDVIDELEAAFPAKMGTKGEFQRGLTISFNGKMTLLAALLQIENLFDAEMEIEGDKLWFVALEKDE